MKNECCRLEISPRPTHLGGGWRLRIIENGEEVGGGAFPLSAHDPEGLDAYEEALSAGLCWAEE